MSMKKIATLSVAMSFAVISASAQEVFHIPHGAVGSRVPIEAKHVKGAPYSAEIVTENIQMLFDGNRIVQRSTSRVYRDSEGRVRREEDRDSGSPVISITDPVAGTSFRIDTENRVAWQTSHMAGFAVTEALHRAQMLLSHELGDLHRKMEEARNKIKDAGKAAHEKIARAEAESVRAGEQVKVEQLAERIIEGVPARGVRRTTTIAARAIGNELPIEIVSEEWTSPELKMLILTERKDPRLGTSTYRVMNINRAEPDRHLFEVPSDYTVNQTGVIRKSLGGGARGSSALPALKK